MKQVKVAGCALLFKCRHVMNADSSAKALVRLKTVFNILWLHLLAYIIWSLLTFNKYKFRPTQTILPLCCSASSAEGRLHTGRGNAPHYSLVQWPRGEMKNSPLVLIPKTLNTLILSSQGALLLASSAAMVTATKPLVDLL